MLVDDAVDGEQPQPRSRLLGGKVRIKDFIQGFWWDAGPFIRQDHFHILAQAQRASGMLVIHGNVGGGHSQGTSFRHSLHGVDRQIIEHLVDLPGINFHRPEFLFKSEPGLGQGAAQGKFNSLLEHGGKIPARRDRDSPAGEGCQLLGDPPGTAGGLFGVLQHTGCFGVVLQVQAGSGQVEHDAHEEIIEIVGQPAGQDTKGFQFCRPEHFRLQPTLLGNIPDNHNHTDDLTLPIFQG
ncbi:hypothetical protein ES703_08255 [subsurface metagenome]